MPRAIWVMSRLRVARRSPAHSPQPSPRFMRPPRVQLTPFFCLRSPILGCNTQPRHDRDMSKRGCGCGSATSIASCSKSACGIFVRFFGNAVPQAASNGQRDDDRQGDGGGSHASRLSLIQPQPQGNRHDHLRCYRIRTRRPRGGSTLPGMYCATGSRLGRSPSCMPALALWDSSC